MVDFWRRQTGLMGLIVELTVWAAVIGTCLTLAGVAFE